MSIAKPVICHFTIKERAADRQKEAMNRMHLAIHKHTTWHQGFAYIMHSACSLTPRMEQALGIFQNDESESQTSRFISWSTASRQQPQ